MFDEATLKLFLCRYKKGNLQKQIYTNLLIISSKFFIFSFYFLNRKKYAQKKLPQFEEAFPESKFIHYSDKTALLITKLS